MRTQPLASSRLRPILGFMVPRKNKPPSKPELFTFERKILLWLADRAMSMRHLSTMCGFTPSTLHRWVRNGAKMPATALTTLSNATQLPAWYWLDETAPYPPDPRVLTAEAVFQSIPQEERERLAPILADPVERRAWLASWSARRARPK